MQGNRRLWAWLLVLVLLLGTGCTTTGGGRGVTPDAGATPPAPGAAPLPEPAPNGGATRPAPGVQLAPDGATPPAPGVQPGQPGPDRPAGPLPGPLPGAPLAARQAGTEWHYGPVASVWVHDATWGTDGSLAVTMGVEPNPLAGVIRLEPATGQVTHLPFAWDRWSAYDLVGNTLVYATQREVLAVATTGAAGPGGAVGRWPGWAYRISPDRQHLVVFAEPNELVWVDLTDLALVPGRLAFPDLTWSRKMGVPLAWSPDGRRIAVEDYRGKVTVIDTAAWRIVAELQAGRADQAEQALQVAGGWSPDGALLAMRVITAETAPCASPEGPSAPARKLAFYDAGRGKVTMVEPAPGRWVSPWGAGWTRTGYLRINLLPATSQAQECRAPALADTYYYHPVTGSLTPAAGMGVADLLRVGEGLWAPDGRHVLLHLPDPTGRERGNGILNLPPVYGQQAVRQLLVRASDGQVVREMDSAEWWLGPWVGSDALVAAKPGSAGTLAKQQLALLTTDGDLKVVADLPEQAYLPPEPISPDGRFYSYLYRTEIQPHGQAKEWLAVGRVK